MSIKSWKAEFYSTEAINVSEADAVEHSLVKWIGLRPENLQRHDITKKRGKNLYDGAGDCLAETSLTCSLCILCRDYVGCTKCQRCPITLVSGKSCDFFEDGQTSPWHHWILTGDPEPMIRVLEQCKKEGATVQPF
jgi:hypothetical protein